jgi:hypothetical protein
MLQQQAGAPEISSLENAEQAEARSAAPPLTTTSCRWCERRPRNQTESGCEVLETVAQTAARARAGQDKGAAPPPTSSLNKHTHAHFPIMWHEIPDNCWELICHPQLNAKALGRLLCVSRRFRNSTLSGILQNLKPRGVGDRRSRRQQCLSSNRPLEEARNRVEALRKSSYYRRGRDRRLLKDPKGSFLRALLDWWKATPVGANRQRGKALHELALYHMIQGDPSKASVTEDGEIVTGIFEPDYEKAKEYFDQEQVVLREVLERANANQDLLEWTLTLQELVASLIDEAQLCDNFACSEGGNVEDIDLLKLAVEFYKQGKKECGRFRVVPNHIKAKYERAFQRGEDAKNKLKAALDEAPAGLTAALEARALAAPMLPQGRVQIDEDADLHPAARPGEVAGKHVKDSRGRGKGKEIGVSGQAVSPREGQGERMGKGGGEGSRRVSQAHVAAVAAREEAERITREAAAEAERMRVDARLEAQQIVDDAHRAAQQVQTRARETAEEEEAGAQEPLSTVSTKRSQARKVEDWSMQDVLAFFERFSFPTEGVVQGCVDGKTLLFLLNDEKNALANFTDPVPDGMGFSKLLFRGKFKMELNQALSA